MTEEQDTTPKRGRGRPPKFAEAMRPTPAVFLPREDIAYIRRMCAALDISWAQYVRQALTAYRETHEGALSPEASSGSDLAPTNDLDRRGERRILVPDPALIEDDYDRRAGHE